MGYDLNQPRETLVSKLRENGITVLISCITWEHLDLQIPWIEAAKEAGVERFVPSEWVGPAPAGVIDIKDRVKLFHSVPFSEGFFDWTATGSLTLNQPDLLTTETGDSGCYTTSSSTLHANRCGLLACGFCSQDPLWEVRWCSFNLYRSSDSRRRKPEIRPD